MIPTTVDTVSVLSERVQSFFCSLNFIHDAHNTMFSALNVYRNFNLT